VWNDVFVNNGNNNFVIVLGEGGGLIGFGKVLEDFKLTKVLHFERCVYGRNHEWKQGWSCFCFLDPKIGFTSR